MFDNRITYAFLLSLKLYNSLLILLIIKSCLIKFWKNQIAIKTNLKILVYLFQSTGFV